MVYVDFANPYLRRYLARHYGETHRRQLAVVTASLERLVAAAQAAEAAQATAAAQYAPRPLAAVLDIDEVILSNIHMNVHGDFHACDYYLAPDGQPWPRDDTRLNPELPGARELITKLRRLGIAIFLVTGRGESLRAETAENFAFVGLAGDVESIAGKSDYLFSFDALLRPSGPLYMCPDADLPPLGVSIRPFKEACRGRIERTHRIMLNVGDQASDLGLHGDNQVHCTHPFYFTV